MRACENTAEPSAFVDRPAVNSGQPPRKNTAQRHFIAGILTDGASCIFSPASDQRFTVRPAYVWAADGGCPASSPTTSAILPSGVSPASNNAGWY